MWRSLVVTVCAAFALVGLTWTGDVGVMKPQSVSAQSAKCPGDFNGDGTVNLADFLAFAGGFGTRSGDANYNARLDLNGSGSIDLSDFLAFAGVFGTTCEDQPRGSVSGDRAALVALYIATDGPNWVDNTNWLTDAPLGEWYGVDTDASGRVVSLHLFSVWDNEKQDSVPFGLEGPIPPELGNLTNLVELVLSGNAFSGPIPPELGNLSNLVGLFLYEAGLSGEIPPELGNLSNLENLDLSENAFSGPIPPELGALSNLDSLFLSENGLVGPIPPELGALSNLEVLSLFANDLSGPVPDEFGAMAGLRKLELSSNEALAGPLPASLTGLQLRTLTAAATDLCAPLDPAFLSWLTTLPESWVARCGEAAAYLVQAVQSRTHPVPLVAGEGALLRVFVTAARETQEGMPRARARFYRDGAEWHVADVPAKSAPIPTEVDEGDLSGSINAEIPGRIVASGLEMVIEIDPDGVVDEGLGVPRRIPETGRLAVEVREMHVLHLTAITFLWTEDPDSTVIEIVEGMSDDPEGHTLLEDTRVQLPVGGIEVRAHEPVASTSNNALDLLNQTEAIRVLEGGDGHYVGMMSPWASGFGGIAIQSGRSSFSMPNAHVIAHELGHNMSLGHAPCGGTGVGDPSFPHPGGSIGAWGYDHRRGLLVSPASWKDLMSYCDPPWISDYHFTRALQWRLFNEAESAEAVVATPVTSLLLWGGVDVDGNPFLNPAFVAEARPALPDSAGEYTLSGRDAAGRELFSLSFAMGEVASEEGAASSFTFALPVRPSWAGALATVTLSGPDAVIALDDNTDRPMAILRDIRTGQVRAFLSDRTAAEATQAAEGTIASKPGAQVLFSRGIPVIR